MNGLYYLEECSSTNDEISSFAEFHDDESFALYTFNQTKGRGQYGNSWESPKNENLAFSFAFSVSEVKIPDSLFNFYTANILREFLANLTTGKVEIKWPNDIIIRQKKVSGILIEKRKIKTQYYFVIGIGVNVLQNQFSGIPNAGSLLTQTGSVFDLHEVAEKLYLALNESLQSEVLENEIIENYNQYLFCKNQIAVFENKGLRQNGIIKKADKKGFIWIDLETEGLQKFYFKEIKMLY